MTLEEKYKEQIKDMPQPEHHHGSGIVQPITGQPINQQGPKHHSNNNIVIIGLVIVIVLLTIVVIKNKYSNNKHAKL